MHYDCDSPTLQRTCPYIARHTRHYLFDIFFYSFVNLFHHKQISDKIIYVEVVSITIKKKQIFISMLMHILNM